MDSPTYGCRGMSVHPQNLWHLFELLFPKSSATEWLPCYVLLSAPRMNFGFFLELAVYPIRKPSFITVNIWSPLCRSSKHVLLQAACIFLVLSLQILYRIFCFFSLLRQLLQPFIPSVQNESIVRNVTFPSRFFSFGLNKFHHFYRVSQNVYALTLVRI